MLRSKIETLLNLFFTEFFLLLIFCFFLTIIFFYFYFLSKTLGFLFFTFCAYFFFFLIKLWEKTKTGQIFLNFFDKIIIIKPLTIEDKFTIFDDILKKKGIVNKLSQEEKLLIITKEDHKNITRESFTKQMDDLITYLCKKFQEKNLPKTELKSDNFGFLDTIYNFALDHYILAGVATFVLGTATLYLTGMLSNTSAPTISPSAYSGPMHYFPDPVTSDIVPIGTNASSIQILDDKINKILFSMDAINADFIKATNAYATSTNETDALLNSLIPKLHYLEIRLTKIESLFDDLRHEAVSSALDEGSFLSNAIHFSQDISSTF